MGVYLSSLGSSTVDLPRNGHTYTSIVTRDNARAHYGDSINVQNYHTSISLWPKSPPASTAIPPSPELRIPKRERIKDTEDIEGPHREGQNPVEMAINHLSELYQNARYREKDGDARRLLTWIRVLIDLFTDEHVDSQLEHTLDGLHSLKDGLLMSNCVKVNSVSASRRTLPTHILDVKRISSVITVGKWKLQLHTIVCGSVDTAGRDVSESFSSLRLSPCERSSLGGSSVAAFFGEREDYLQRSVLHPTIISYRNVDSSSKVFKLIEADDVNGLTRLIALREASTRDCDEEGRSLLYLACAHISPKCCKFLIDCGADVDRPDVVLSSLDSDALSTPLHISVKFPVMFWFGSNHHRAHNTLATDRTELVRLLIQGEADPTLVPTSRQGSRSSLALALDELRATEGGSPEQERFHLMLGGAFADLKAADEASGLSIWLYACINAIPDILQRLLAAGCSVAETDVEDPARAVDECYRPNWIVNKRYTSGWSCLFFVVLHASRPECSAESESLRILLGAGADPFLRDAKGFTIFDYVNGNVSSEFTGYRRELWYNALTRAHIHIDHLVKPGQKISMSPVYSYSFTPTLCRALRHLESWERNDFQSQVDKLLVDIPWSEEEEEALARVKDLTPEGRWSDLTVEGRWSEESEDRLERIVEELVNELRLSF